MPTTKQTITGFLVVTAGVVGAVLYPTQTDAPTLEPDQVIIQVKSELANEPEEIAIKGGLTYSIKRLKTYKSPDGAMSDTPKAGYTLVTDPAEMITQSTIVETAAEKTARLKANATREAAQKIKSDNERIYKQIGELETLRLGKVSAGVPTTEEDSEVKKLKLKLK